MFFDHILDGHDATEENAYDHARGLDWQEIETSEGDYPYLNYVDTVNGVGIWYNYGHDAYYFSDESDAGESWRYIEEDLNANKDIYYRTKEDWLRFIKQFKEKNKKAPQLDFLLSISRDDAIHHLAILVANKILGHFSWDELPDTNSMWDYIDYKNGMKKDDFIESVKEAVNDRLADSDMGIGGLEDLMENLSEEKTNKEKIIDMIIQTGLDLANDQISQEEHDKKVKELENVLKNN